MNSRICKPPPNQTPTPIKLCLALCGNLYLASPSATCLPVSLAIVAIIIILLIVVVGRKPARKNLPTWRNSASRRLRRHPNYEINFTEMASVYVCSFL